MADALFYCRSSERMTEIENDAIALTVTSPPYWNAIDYDIHANGDGSEWYRTRKYNNGFEGYDEYLHLLTRIFSEVFRVTKPGGFCAIVIGTVLMDGRHVPVPFDITARLVSAGWEFHQDIIWHKTTAGVRRAGSFIQKPYPGYYYPNIMTEYILMFRKPGHKIYKQANEYQGASKFEIDDLFKKDVANNIWHIAPVPPRTIDHPCPFPEEIPYRVVSLYSYKGDIVLDPFVGSGQTTKVAFALGRNTVGYDSEEKYIEYAKERLTEPLRLRAKQLIAKFEKTSLNLATSYTNSDEQIHPRLIQENREGYAIHIRTT
ncbi:MAG: site-specific DNA-methyltransferase [Chloroflexi bacterium]|nr:site-specific DNA-methyltransferase [Chloroflexota bacterium]